MRQMYEYKREKQTLESRLNQMSKAATHHNDHLRVIDSWFNQLIDEVKVLLGSQEVKETSFKSSLQFEDAEGFESHLKSRSDDIREIISQFQSKLADASPDVTSLQSKLAKKLAEEKVTIAELEKALAEKQQLEESLEAACMRYMVAEKKLDRARSVTATKLDKQYIMGGNRPNTEVAQTKREESSPANGGTPVGDRSVELEEANNKLSAVSEKQKEQLQKLEAENASLLSQITELKVKVR
jgi:E3 ubiquitin-protein ligase BRE1